MLSSKEIKLLTLLAVDTVFCVLELSIGYLSHSLALIADSFHMLNDIVSLLIALWAVNVAKNRNPDSKYTYGWKRAEILGALMNAVFLIALCFTITVEALQRLLDPPDINNPKLVMIVGIFGLLSNLFGLVLFHDSSEQGHGHSHGLGSDEPLLENENAHSHDHDHSHVLENHRSPRTPVLGVMSNNIEEILPATVVSRITDENTALLSNEESENIIDLESDGHTDDHEHSHSPSPTGGIKSTKKRRSNKKHRSLNMHGVFLHVLGDALGNIGVIASAYFIWTTDYSWRFYADPLVSLFITIIIFSSAIPLSRKASKILLQATPSSISADDIKNEILSLPGVISIHDFHIWNLTESFFIATLHVYISATPDNFSNIAMSIRDIMHEYNIHSVTVQPEFLRNTNSSNKNNNNPGNTNEEEDHCSTVVQDSIRSHHQNPLSTYGSMGELTVCLANERAKCSPLDCLKK